MKKRKKMKRVLQCFIVICIVGITTVFGINIFVKSSVKNKIISQESALKLKDVSCILVLGAGVKPDGKPSLMLKDRLDKAIELYKAKVAPKILMSGDHGTVGYDEVDEMKNYAMKAGVPSKDIFMDHAGFSTYESMYRAKEIFQIKKMVIVTQEYHLYRALYDANKFDIEAFGIAANKVEYGGQSYRDLREIAARDKDFVVTILKTKPTYLGDPIPIMGNGDLTNGKLNKN